MPKTFDPDYQAALQTSAKFAQLAAITLSTGAIARFTTEEGDIEYPVGSGDWYLAKNAMLPIEPINSAPGSEVERARFRGALGDAVTRDMIRKGFLDGASIEVINVTFDDLDRGHDVLIAGVVGQVKILSKLEFEFEARDYMHLAAVEVNPSIRMLCPFKLYGDECGLSIVGKQVTVDVISVSADGLTIRIPVQAGRKFKRGWIEANEGDNVGVRPIQIKEHTVDTAPTPDEDVLTLFQPFPMTLTAGTEVEVTEGCTKDPTRCQELNNYPRYGGHPNVPGEDKRQDNARNY